MTSQTKSNLIRTGFVVVRCFHDYAVQIEGGRKVSRHETRQEAAEAIARYEVDGVVS